MRKERRVDLREVDFLKKNVCLVHVCGVWAVQGGIILFKDAVNIIRDGTCISFNLF